MIRALFVSWDGPGTTYLESLFFPLFAALRPRVEVAVLQLTWGEAVGDRAAAAGQHGIDYQAVRVPAGGALGTAWALARGPAAVRAAVRRTGATVLYPRALLPLAVALRARRGEKLVFDADGLVADERVEFAGWRADGPGYRWYRGIEARGVREADRVVTRTERAREILLARAGPGHDPARVVAIGNGKDETLFSPGTSESRAGVRRAAGVPSGALWSVYCGSLGPQYHLDEMIAFHRLVRREQPEARLTLLTRATPAVAEPGVEVVACPIAEIPGRLAAADVGLSFRTPSFSMAGVSPIKVGEYLLAGLPVLGNTGIGDLDSLLAPPAALLLPSLAPAGLERAARWCLHDVLAARGDLRVAARALGEQAFSLRRTAEATARLFEEVAR